VTHPVLVLQHAPWERPGLISQALAEGAPGVPGLTRTVAAEPRPNLPAARDLAGLVVMGGSMNAEDDAHFPGLAAERRLLAEAVDTAVPVLGVCLGLQLLARALGATEPCPPSRNAPSSGWPPSPQRSGSAPARGPGPTGAALRRSARRSAGSFPSQ